MSPQLTDTTGSIIVLLTPGRHVANVTATGYNSGSFNMSIPVNYNVDAFTFYLSPVNLKENIWNNLTVYPNPTHNKLLVVLPENQVQDIIVTDMLGKKVSVQNVTEGNTLTLNVSGLANGIYNVTVITRDKNYRALFVVE